MFIGMAEKIEVGSIVEGKVVRIKPFGAIVAIENGPLGLVHISQIANSFVQRIEDHVNIGDVVQVKVLSVDPATNKVALSIREALPKPETSPARPRYERKQNAYETQDNGAPVNNDFEEKMREWLKASNEKQAGINKRNNRRQS